MNKKQAEEYYEELKKMDKAKNMELADVIHILISSISSEKAQEFIDHVLSNEFGEYGHIYQYVEEYDWKKLPFSKIYQVLKYIKVYLKKQKLSNPEKSQSERGMKDLISSFDSKQPNNTVDQILNNFKQKSEGSQSEVKVLEFSSEMDYEEKWKLVKFRLVKKLLVIFDYMRKTMHREGQTFEKNKEFSQTLDITTFMKYIKMFQLGNTFKTHRIIKAFKQSAVNTIWVDFDRFVEANLAMIGFKQSIPSKQKYLRLQGLFDLIKSEDMKKMLNVRVKTVLATIVQGHTGTYKQDILDFLHQKYEERRVKQLKKWNGKRIKTENSKSVPLNKGELKIKGKIVKVSSAKKLTSTKNNQLNPSIYEQLKLPQLRVRQQKQQSIYQSLKNLDVSLQKQKLKEMINFQQREEYLDQYLKDEAKTSQVRKKKQKSKKLYDLPPMRFT